MDIDHKLRKGSLPIIDSIYFSETSKQNILRSSSFFLHHPKKQLFPQNSCFLRKQSKHYKHIYKSTCSISHKSTPQSTINHNLSMRGYQQLDNSQKNELRNNGKTLRSCQDRSDQAQSACGQYYRQVIKQLKEYLHFTCEICTKQFEKSEIQCLTNCGHTHFCQTCINIYIRIKINTYEVIHCPKDGCKAVANTESPFFKNLPSQFQRRYRKFRMSVQKQSDANFRVCPQEKCEGNIVFKLNCFCCKLCKKEFCLNCLGPVHKDQCYSKQLTRMQQTLGLRRCPKCKFFIERTDGCNHMRCYCKFQFCYRCNDAWRPLHQCQRDSSYRIVMKTPKFIEETVVNEPKEQVNLVPGAQSGVTQNVLLFLFILGFIIPSMIALALVFIIWMALRGIVFFIHATLITLLIILLGMGPFTAQVSQRFKKSWRMLFWLAYPLSMTLGIHLSMRELLCYAVRPLSKRYFQRGKKLWNYLFVDLFE